MDHGAAKALHRGAHFGDRTLQTVHRLLGIQPINELRRTDDVGEHYGRMLALTLHRFQGRATLDAETRPGRIGKSTSNAGRSQLQATASAIGIALGVFGVASQAAHATTLSPTLYTQRNKLIS